MNFLELCQAVRREAQIPGTGPTVVTDQVGQLAEVVEAVKEAWRAIQEMHESWTFRLGLSDAQLVAGKVLYTPFELGMPESISHITQVLIDGRAIENLDWVQFEAMITKQADRKGAPGFWTETPDRKIKFYPEPDSSYPVRIFYVKELQELVDELDKPNIPERYHRIVQWKATMDLVINEGDQLVYQKAYEKYDNLLAQMEVHLLPKIKLGGTTFS